jgi:ribosome-associated translation inhibitor RaiA
MQVLVHSDRHFVGGEDLTERVREVIEGRLGRFEGRITRVEAHLQDLNGGKPGERETPQKLRCLMEARLGGLKPIAVSHEAPVLIEAINAAADKLARAIAHALGKRQDRAGRAAQRRAPEQDAGSGAVLPPDSRAHDDVASIETLQALERAEADRRR